MNGYVKVFGGPAELGTAISWDKLECRGYPLGERCANFKANNNVCVNSLGKEESFDTSLEALRKLFCQACPSLVGERVQEWIRIASH